MASHCFNCRSESITHDCGRCGMISFCSVKCSDASAEEHKQICFDANSRDCNEWSERLAQVEGDFDSLHRRLQKGDEDAIAEAKWHIESDLIEGLFSKKKKKAPMKRSNSLTRLVNKAKGLLHKRKNSSSSDDEKQVWDKK